MSDSRTRRVSIIIEKVNSMIKECITPFTTNTGAIDFHPKDEGLYAPKQIFKNLKGEIKPLRTAVNRLKARIQKNPFPHDQATGSLGAGKCGIVPLGLAVESLDLAVSKVEFLFTKEPTAENLIWMIFQLTHLQSTIVSLGLGEATCKRVLSPKKPNPNFNGFKKKVE